MNKKKITIIGLVLLLAVIVGITFFPGYKQEENQGVNQEETQDVVREGTQEETQEVDQEINQEDKEETFEIVERVEASYEKWLAASLVTGIAMQYPDCEFEGIYLCSENTLEDKSKSKGVCVTFVLEGEERAIQTVPLTEERQESGTKDLYTKELGFSTFDEVEVEDLQFENYEKVTVKDLSETMEQTILVTIIER